MAEPDLVQQLGHVQAARAGCGGAGEPDVVADVEVADEVAGLQQDTDPLGPDPGTFPLRAVADPLSADAHDTAGWLVQPCQAGQQGGLARTGGAHNSHPLTAPHPEAHSAQSQRLLLARTEEPVQLVCFQGVGGLLRRIGPVARGGHHCQPKESVTVRHGSTLSAPTGPDSVRSTSRPLS